MKGKISEKLTDVERRLDWAVWREVSLDGERQLRDVMPEPEHEDDELARSVRSRLLR